MWRSDILAGLLSVCWLDAAVIRGSVVENQTGKFLARATVLVEPIAGTPGGALSMRTNVSGLFEFSALAPGVYLVKVSRPGFMPMEYGQKRWNSAGASLFLDDSAPAFLSIRLPRWSAITGTVVDENDVGLPEHDVVAYRNTRPPELVARAHSDERGVYRMSGLEPGTYLVRTAGAQYDEGAYLPTFSRESIPVENARLVDVDLDQQADHIDIRPLPGTLFTLSGEVVPDPPGAPTRVSWPPTWAARPSTRPHFNSPALPPALSKSMPKLPPTATRGLKCRARTSRPTSAQTRVGARRSRPTRM